MLLVMKRVEMTAVMQEINRDPSSLCHTHNLKHTHTHKLSSATGWPSYTHRPLCHKETLDLNYSCFILFCGVFPFSQISADTEPGISVTLLHLSFFLRASCK